MKTRFLKLALIISSLALAACGAKTTSTMYSQFLSSTTPAAPADDGTEYPLAIQVASFWQDDTTGTVLLPTSGCNFTTADALGSTKNCNLSVPEGRLWFSTLRFSMISYQVGTKVCDAALFFPYYYEANNASATFNHWWASGTTPCNTAVLAGNCYGGIGRQLLAGFPNTLKYNYFHPANQSSDDWTPLQTPNQLALLAGKGINTNNLGTNTHTTNSLTDRTTPLAFANDGYVANTMQDYVFQCLDKHAQVLYQINLFIDDDAPNSGFLAPPAYSASGFKSLWP